MTTTMTTAMSTTETCVERPTALSDDRTLVGLLQQRDPAAIAEVWRRHSAMVIRAAQRVTRSDALAHEIAQDVFTTLWKQPERVDLDRGSLASFLGSVARNRSVDVVRHEAARRRREERTSADPSTAGRPDDPVDVVLHDELTLRVRAAVAELPSHEREAVELAWFGGHAYRQVAIALGVPEGTAKTRIREGMRRMSRTLADDRVLSCA